MVALRVVIYLWKNYKKQCAFFYFSKIDIDSETRLSLFGNPYSDSFTQPLWYLKSVAKSDIYMNIDY